MDWSRDLDSLTLGLRKGRAEVDAWLDEEEEELELIGTRQSLVQQRKGDRSLLIAISRCYRGVGCLATERHFL